MIFSILCHETIKFKSSIDKNYDTINQQDKIRQSKFNGSNIGEQTLFGTNYYNKNNYTDRNLFKTNLFLYIN